MSTLTGTIQDILASKATDTSYGLAKVSESTTVTETDSGLVLSAKEKNPAVTGTIANGQKKLQDDFNSLFDSALKTYSKYVNNSVDALESGIYNVGISNGDIPVSYGVLVVFRSTNGYLVQMLKSVVLGEDKLYIRTFDNNITWSPWRYITLAILTT